MLTLVIGAGVAGLFFANFMDCGEITILEKNEFPGRKLLASGNGRCNFTNLNFSYDFYKSENEDFFKYSLDNFTNYDLIKYLNDIGIATTNLPSGRCYPKTMSSKTIRDALYNSSKENSKFIFNQEVKAINFLKKEVLTNEKSYSYDKLVFATGGKSLANSGSDGKIFALIKNEIPLTKMTYGITNFESKEKFSKKAKGTRITGKASLFVEGKFIKSSIDDIIFQDYGLTGTAILDISNDLSLALRDKKKASVEIDFYPEKTYEEFYDFLEKTIKNFPNKSLSDLLIGIINEKLIGDVINLLKLSPKKKLFEVKTYDLEKLVKTLKNLSFEITKIHDSENAQLTIGGVDTKFVNPKSMESKIFPDVFFIGEILDVNGACGGYNIQWAASSAKVLSDYLRSLNV